MFAGTKNADYETSDLKSKVGNLFRVGKIEEIRDKVEEPPQDEETHNWTNEDQQGQFRGQFARIKMGEGSPEERDKTYWMPIAANRAGQGGISYDYYSVGEQVLLACESGNPMTTWVIKAAYQDEYRPPVSWDQPTKDRRAWDSKIKQYQCEDTSYFEFRDAGCPVVPDDGRLLFAGLKSADQLFEYYTHPEKRLLHIHIKETLIELDGNYTLNVDEDGTVHIKGEHNLTVDKDTNISTDNLTIQCKGKMSVNAATTIDLTAGEAINLAAPTINAQSSDGSGMKFGGGNTEITSSKSNIITAGQVNTLTDGATPHGHG
jgi:phage baseplate assembly protein gpV